MKILVADDEEGFRQILRELLSKRGHKVDLASDGPAALELIKSGKYDLAFLDFTMPEMTGMEVVEAAKQLGIKTRTILVTAYTLIEDSFVKAAGVDEYLSKPFKLTDLELILKKYKDA